MHQIAEVFLEVRASLRTQVANAVRGYARKRRSRLRCGPRFASLLIRKRWNHTAGDEHERQKNLREVWTLSFVPCYHLRSKSSF